MRLGLERLEDRTVPSNFTAATVSDLIADINAANLAGGSNTITLVAGNRFTLTEPDNSTERGYNGLPVIAVGDDLDIIGNGDIIERSTDSQTLPFRFFELPIGAALALSNLTLQGGLASSIGLSAEGGAVYNQGTLLLNGVTVQNNTARGSDAIIPVGTIFPTQGFDGLGGGIFSGGVLTLEGCTVQNNMAIGGRGGEGLIDPFYGFVWPGTQGGDVWGGGLFVSGTLSINNTVLTGNTAHGGTGGTGLKGLSGDGSGGRAFGGGIYMAVGTLTVHNTSVTRNIADGGKGGNSSGASHGDPGAGMGGGIYIDPTASAGLDAFTVNHFQHNRASTSNDDIFGSYDLIS
jgi:hypothetical protein